MIAVLQAAATPPTSSAARCATRARPAGPRLGPRHRRPPERTRAVPRRGLRESVRDASSARWRSAVEITTFRTDHDYADFRRPHRVEFGDVDRGRPRAPRLHDQRHGLGRVDAAPRPGCSIRMAARRIGGRRPAGGRRSRRPVRRGRPSDGPGGPPLGDARVRRSSRRRWRPSGPTPTSRPPVRRADRRRAREAPRRPEPVGRTAPARDDRTPPGIAPELAAQRGIPQNKIAGEDLWDHRSGPSTRRRRDRPIVRLAALVHDIGKPATFADGRFLGHDGRGRARGELLPRLTSPVRRSTGRPPRAPPHVQPTIRVGRCRDPTVHRQGRTLVTRRAVRAPPGRQHRERPRPGCRRSGRAPGAGGRAARGRGRARPGDLAVDGDDLIAELGAEPGPRLGALLDELVEAVVEDPGLNDRPTLLLLAQSRLAGED